MSTLEPAAGLRARGRIYGLLARLLLRGVDEEMLGTLRELEWLVPADVGGKDIDDVLDDLAAAHHRCFHLELFPYAGVFLDPRARAGACSDQARGYYERVGFAVRLDELSADHLGILLSFACFASAAAGEALEDGEREIAARLQQVLAEFFDALVLSWLPALVCAAASLADPYWPGVLRAALEIVAEHRASLPGAQEPGAKLGSGEDILADPRTGLRRIGEQLLVPSATGLCLTRSDLARLSSVGALPRGFGSRVLMLDNLLRSAVSYGELPSLLANLSALVDARDAQYAELGTSLGLEAALEPWRAALDATLELIDELARAAA